MSKTLSRSLLMFVLLQSSTSWSRTALAREDDLQQQTPEARCVALLEQASGYLGDEQYPAMLRVSEERQRLCPGPVSAFLVGLAQGNMVEYWIEEDPARREMLRQEAVRHLQVATAGGHALRPVWRFTAHDWLVHLRDLAPTRGQAAAHTMLAARFAAAHSSTGPYGPNDDSGYGATPILPPPAPPPPPHGHFPVGPAALGGVSLGALVAGLVTALNAADKQAIADHNERIIAEVVAEGGGDNVRIATAQENANILRNRADLAQAWSTGLLVFGSFGIAGAAAWYFLIPPKHGWEWSLSPGSVRVSGRF